MFTSRLIITAIVLATSAVFSADLHAQESAAVLMARAVEAEEVGGDPAAALSSWAAVLRAKDATPAQVQRARKAVARLRQVLEVQKDASGSRPVPMEQLHTWVQMGKKDQILSLGAEAGPMLLDYVLNYTASQGKPSVLGRALGLLVKLPNPRIVSAIQDAVVDENIYWASAWVKAVQKLNREQGRPWRMALTRAADSDDVDLRLEVAHTFIMHTPVGMGVWKALLRDEDERVQSAALNSMMLNPELPLEEVKQQLSLVLQSPFVSVRKVLAGFITQYRAPARQLALDQVPQLLRDRSAAVRLEVMKQASKYFANRPWPKGDFEPVLKDPDPEVRKRALTLFLQLDSEGSLQRLIDALEDESSEVRSFAVANIADRFQAKELFASSVAQRRLVELGDTLTGTARRHAMALVALGGHDLARAYMKRLAQSGIPQEVYAAANYAMIRNEVPLNGNWPELVDLFATNGLSLSGRRLNGMPQWCLQAGVDRLLGWLDKQNSVEGLLQVTKVLFSKDRYSSSLLGKTLMRAIGPSEVGTLQKILSKAQNTNLLNSLLSGGGTEFARWLSAQPGSSEVYRALLASDDVKLRRLGGQGLRWVGVPSDVPALLTALAQDSNQFHDYIYAIKELAAPEHATAIGAAIRDSELQNVRSNLFSTLSVLPGSAADQEILKIEKSSTGLQFGPMLAIAERKIKGALPEVLRRIQRHDSQAKEHCRLLSALGAIGSLEHVDVLLEDFLLPLANVSGARTLPILRERGADPSRPYIGYHASAIFELGSEAVMVAIKKIQEDRRYTKLLGYLITCLAYVPGGEASDYVLEALDHPVGSVRSRAAAVAGHLLQVKAVKRLRELLRDPEAATAANSALLRIQDLSK